MVELREMDDVQMEYLRFNKYYMTFICTWPYLTVLQRCFIGIVYIPVIAAQGILQGGGLLTAAIDSDIEAFMEGFAPFVVSLMCLSKYVNYFYNYKQTKRIFNIMQEDWQIYGKLRHEYDLLCEQYAFGRKITFNLGAFMFGLITPFAAMPLLVNVADAVGFMNISDDRPIVFRVEHFVDVDKYYYALLIHSYFGTIAYAAIVVSLNSLVAVYVQHECGLCEILRFRLEKFVDGDEEDTNVGRIRDKSYENAKDCVILHKHIIEFANILEDANTTASFFHLGFNMIGISFTQFQAAINLADTAKAFRYICISICLLCDLLFVSWPGQRLADCTERIFEHTTNGKWYQSSISCQKVLLLMLAKSITPLKLTACKLYTLNLESFSAVLRASFSYTMVLCSFQ